MSRNHKTLIFILLLSLACLYLNIPKDFRFAHTFFGKHIDFVVHKPKIDISLAQTKFYRSLDFNLGLDIRGGMQVTLKLDMSQIDSSKREQALESARSVLSRRVDLYGVSESTIRTSVNGDEYRIIVELPGVDKPQEALKLIGQTAGLVFATPVYQANPASPSAEPQLVDFAPTDLSGSDLEGASVTFETQDRKPAVSLQFKDSGKEKFAKITEEYIGKPVAILLDQSLLSSPVVQSVISNGQAIITGSFTSQEAKFLATQLNAGALPVPISVLDQKNISATLGDNSIKQSLTAGLVGLAVVVGFMSLYYGWLGVIACLGLVIYTLITATIYKLVPITLTLPGIAGFILSIGMAVDSNILIFERFKEEIRAGRSWQAALELGFGRAWDSIKDANLATIITGLILFNPLNWNFLNTSGSVRGFALTLLIGILVSLFTGIIVTRNLLRFFYKGHALPQSSVQKHK